MKPHLLLVHSFPTNSVLLHGLEEFLSDFFTVHFIDLPGFHKNSPPFNNEVSIENFSNYLDQKISDLDIDEYTVGGISFGFSVVNNAKLDKRCKAILAVEPFVNSKYLNTSYRTSLVIMMGLIHFFHIEKLIWESKWFRQYLQKESGYPKERIDMIINHIDPRTFFSVAKLILNYNEEPIFHNLPYFLIGNFEDKTIDFNSIVEVFKKNIQKLKIIAVPIDHYPKDPSKEYFTSKITMEHMHRILAGIE